MFKMIHIKICKTGKQRMKISSITLKLKLWSIATLTNKHIDITKIWVFFAYCSSIKAIKAKRLNYNKMFHLKS